MLQNASIGLGPDHTQQGAPSARINESQHVLSTDERIYLQVLEATPTQETM